MEPSQDSQPLSYAQRPPAIRRWRWRIAFAALAVVLAVLAVTRGPAVWDRAMLLYWQRQCMNYTAPADQVVYDSIPDDPEALLESGGEALSARDASGPLAVGRIPKPAEEFLLRSGHIFTTGDAVLFLHERTAPGGTRRILVVTCNHGQLASHPLPNALAIWSVEPQGWRERMFAVTGSSTAYVGLRGKWNTAQRLRIYAGQPNPNDPSHFTVRFKRLHEGLIEGRLADDGQVHLLFRGSKEDGFDLPLEGQ